MGGFRRIAAKHRCRHLAWDIVCMGGGDRSLKEDSEGVMVKFFLSVFIAIWASGPVCCVSAASPSTIKIASIYAFSGYAVKNNEPSILGVRFGIDQVNAAGGVLGRRLELIELDNRSTPIGAKVAAERAADMGVAAIVGCAWSSHSMAAAKVAQARGIPMVSNVSTHPDLTGIGDFIFRICFNDNFQGQAMARFARQQRNLSTAVIFTDLTSHYSMGLSSAFHRYFESLGGRILDVLTYKHRQQGFRNAIARALAKCPEAIFIPGHDESGLIIKEARGMGFSAVALGADGWDAPHTFKLGGAALNDAYFCTHWSAVSGAPTSRAFVDAYARGRLIFAAEALGYDAVMLIADAMGRAGTVDREAVRVAIAATRGFEGATGTLSFNAVGDPIKSAIIMQVKNSHPEYFTRIGVVIDSR
jgi:branched-chain amino acid transport system substrate-binding protein